MPDTHVSKKALGVYAIVDRKDKHYWLKIGAAFTNRDGSLTVYLDALPIGTHRLQIREPRVWDDARPLGGGAAGGGPPAALAKPMAEPPVAEPEIQP
jgi:hypothetical protein